MLKLILGTLGILVVVGLGVTGCSYRDAIKRSVYCFLREKGDDASACKRDNPKNEPRPEDAPIPDSERLRRLLQQEGLDTTPAPKVPPAPVPASPASPVPAPTAPPPER